MKVFIAAFDTETNTFTPIPTGYQTFAECFVAHGDATRQEPNYCSAQLHVWRRRAEERGWPVVESLCAVGEPGGTLVTAVYEGFRDEILADLEAAMPVDLVLLALHGAMVAGGYDDCEGDILGRVRAIVGPAVPVGAELYVGAPGTLPARYEEIPYTKLTRPWWPKVRDPFAET